MTVTKKTRKRKTSSKLTASQVGLKYGFRSGFEKDFMEKLEADNISYSYEGIKINYTQPPKPRTYTPDFLLHETGIIIETKGRFTVEDRMKHLWIKDQHPELDIRFIFMNSRSKIRKGSKTSYGDWCDKYGFLYADKEIPPAWLIAKTSSKRRT